MADPRERPYRHVGTHIAFINRATDKSDDKNIQKDGFILVRLLNSRVFIVQSVGNGSIYVQKIVEQDSHTPFKAVKDKPNEIRISTSALADRKLLPPLTVRGRERTYFTQPVLWQLSEDKNFSVYFKFWNGGSLKNLYDKYHDLKRPVPEHFIWHFLLTMVEALRYLHYGVKPGTDGPAKKKWDPIYHRDITLENVVLHYPPKEFPEPEQGWEENAFPELVLVDFGAAVTNKDDVKLVKQGRWDRQVDWGRTAATQRVLVVAEWQDVYAVFQIAKFLCLAFMPAAATGGDLKGRPENVASKDINRNLPANETPYSSALVDTLQAFEWRNQMQSPGPWSSQNVEGQIRHNWEDLPSLVDVVRDYLPMIRKHCEMYRKPGKPPGDPEGDVEGIPDEWWKKLDISWTKPEIMPFECIPDHSETSEPTPAASKKRKATESGLHYDREEMEQQLNDLDDGLSKIRGGRDDVDLEYFRPIISEVKLAPPPGPAVRNPVLGPEPADAPPPAPPAPPGDVRGDSEDGDDDEGDGGDDGGDGGEGGSGGTVIRISSDDSGDDAGAGDGTGVSDESSDDTSASVGAGTSALAGLGDGPSGFVADSSLLGSSAFGSTGLGLQGGVGEISSSTDSADEIPVVKAKVKRAHEGFDFSGKGPKRAILASGGLGQRSSELDRSSGSGVSRSSGGFSRPSDTLPSATRRVLGISPGTRSSSDISGTPSSGGSSSGIRRSTGAGDTTFTPVFSPFVTGSSRFSASRGPPLDSSTSSSDDTSGVAKGRSSALLSSSSTALGLSGLRGMHGRASDASAGDGSTGGTSRDRLSALFGSSRGSGIRPSGLRQSTGADASAEGSGGVAGRTRSVFGRSDFGSSPLGPRLGEGGARTSDDRGATWERPRGLFGSHLIGSSGPGPGESSEGEGAGGEEGAGESGESD